MSRITDRLRITDFDTACQVDVNSVDCVITVCQDTLEEEIDTGAVKYHQYDLADGKRDVERGGECTFQLFERGADTLRAALTNDLETLIHCHAGISRSVSVSAAVLSVLNGQCVSASLEQIREKRRRGHPIERLRDYAKLYAYLHGDVQSIDDVPFEHRPPEFALL